MERVSYYRKMLDNKVERYIIQIHFQGSLADVWFDHFRVFKGEYKPETQMNVTSTNRLLTLWGRIKNME